MKGYKGMSKDMTCRGMQYEIGKSYKVKGEIELCKNGLHFCRNLKDVFDFYEKDDENRFFEIETNKGVCSDDKKSVTSELKIIRELTNKEINRCYYGYGYGYGYGNGNGYGNGYGYGYGYGNGNGYGYGYGYGYGNGYGYGYGNIQKILKFN